MKSHSNSAPTVTGSTLKNIIWALPYLTVMGMIWGYLAAAFTGAVIGLLIAAAAVVFIGTTTAMFSSPPPGDGVDAGEELSTKNPEFC